MIQTVTGRIKGSEAGVTLMHEHISTASPSFRAAFGSAWYDEGGIRALSAEALRLARERLGLSVFVDGTPIDLGRNPTLLREVSERSGVKIVATTGFYYLQGIEATSNDAAALARWFIRECRDGIGETGIKPGILKCATGEAGVTADNRKRLAAMGMVQAETGLPLYVHCEHRGEIAREQIAILTENGASADKIIIGHTSLRPDADYLAGILDAGAYICMDQCHCYPRRIGEMASALVTLAERGYADRLLVANDYCIHSDFCKAEQNGLHLTAEQHATALGYVLTTLRDAYLACGGRERDFGAMLSQNPIAALDVEEN